MITKNEKRIVESENFCCFGSNMEPNLISNSARSIFLLSQMKKEKVGAPFIPWRNSQNTRRTLDDRVKTTS